MDMFQANALRHSLLYLFLLFLAACLVGARSAGAGTWQAIGPEGGRVLTLEADARSPGTLYAGTAAGVFKSSDGAASWTLSRAGLPAGPVTIVRVDSQDSAVGRPSGEVRGERVPASFPGRGRGAGRAWGGGRPEPLPRPPRQVVAQPVAPARESRPSAQSRLAPKATTTPKATAPASAGFAP